MFNQSMKIKYAMLMALLFGALMLPQAAAAQGAIDLAGVWGEPGKTFWFTPITSGDGATSRQYSCDTDFAQYRVTSCRAYATATTVSILIVEEDTDSRGIEKEYRGSIMLKVVNEDTLEGTYKKRNAYTEMSGTVKSGPIVLQRVK